MTLTPAFSVLFMFTSQCLPLLFKSYIYQQTNHILVAVAPQYKGMSVSGSTSAASPKSILMASISWQDTQLARHLSSLTTVKYRDDLGVVDFLPSRDASVIFISEADTLLGGGYRRKVAKFRHSSTTNRQVVVVQNTPLSAQHFCNLQKFVCIELGLSIIPVQTIEETAQLLARMVTSETKYFSNPFRLRLKRTESPAFLLVQSLSLVPGLGGKKAQALLSHFGSMQALALAPREEVEQVVGRTVAVAIREFFDGTAS